MYKYLRDNKKLDFTKRDDMIKYHHDNLIKFYDDIDNEIKNVKNPSMIVRRKYFIEPNGVSDNEIFAYSSFLWRSFTNDKTIKCPQNYPQNRIQPFFLMLNIDLIHPYLVKAHLIYLFHNLNLNLINNILLLI